MSAFDAILRWNMTVFGVAVVWLMFYTLNDWLFAQLAYTAYAHWIFLPAALRVLVVLLLGGEGAIGLMVGAYLTLPHESPNDLAFEIALALSSGLAPLAAVAFCQRLFKISYDLRGLRGSHIIALSVVSGVCGVGGAVVLSILPSLFFPTFDMRAPWWIVLPAFILAVLVGVVFGVGPAWRASRVEILDALRYE